MLPADPKARKAVPVYSGFVKYFPRAMCAVAQLSQVGNDQHNPGKPLHWDRSKSGDEKDALMRHLIDQTIDGDRARDSDGILHATKKAWRAMADLEKILEQLDENTKPDGADWIPWYGESAKSPVENGTAIVIRFRSGTRHRTTMAKTFDWLHCAPVAESDIVAWRPL